MEVVNSNPLNYVVSIPSSVKSGDGGGRPVLCFLHGDGEAAPMPIETALTRHGPLRAGSSQKAIDDFIVVAPQLPANAKGDHWGQYAEAVRNIVTAVQKKYGGNPKQTYLTGFSFGANGVLDMAQSNPNFWAALWAVDPTRTPKASSGRPIWLSMGQRSRNNQSLAELLKLKQATDEAGDYVYLDENQNHVNTATLAYQDDQIYTWLQKHSL